MTSRVRGDWERVGVGVCMEPREVPVLRPQRRGGAPTHSEPWGVPVSGGRRVLGQVPSFPDGRRVLSGPP